MENERVKKWILIYSMLGVCCPLEGKFCEVFIKCHTPLPDKFMGQLHNPIVLAALPQSRPTRSIPILSTLTWINLKEKVSKRKCSTISARHLAQVCRLAMVQTTDENFVACMH
jgi:hypothetical protein